MHIIYSIHEDSKELKLHDCTENDDEVLELLEQVVLDFLVYEEGVRRAKILEGMPIEHDQIEKGYFLHRPDHLVNQIDVYYKSQHIQRGWVGTSVQHQVKKILFFGVVEYAFTAPEDVVPTIITKQKKEAQKNPAMDAVIAELKEELVKRAVAAQTQDDENWDEESDAGDPELCDELYESDENKKHK